MSGNPANARLWEGADVYVSFNLNATKPANALTPFGVDWDLVGLLDGEAGFTESREQEETDHYAWGGILMFTGRRNFKLTSTFTAFEHIETTWRLRWPGSTYTAGEREIYVPKKPERVLVAFETTFDDVVHRVISAYQAEITVNGDITENETDPSAIPYLVTFFPDGAGRLLIEQEGTLTSS